MRHMYDSDGFIPQSRTYRASRPWRSSRTRGPSRPPSREFDKTRAIEVEYTREDHKRRINEILASSKWTAASGY